jgi:hypothetical protein
MAKYVELRRHTDADGDVLTSEGVQAALEIGSRLTGDYELLVSTGAQRATQTLGCLLAGLGEKVPQGAVVEPGLRSGVEERWRATYQKAGSAALPALRKADPELVEEDSAVLAAALRRVLDALPEGVAPSSWGIARRTGPPFSASSGRSSNPSRRAKASSSSRRTETCASRGSDHEGEGLAKPALMAPSLGRISQRSPRRCFHRRRCRPGCRRP